MYPLHVSFRTMAGALWLSCIWRIAATGCVRGIFQLMVSAPLSEAASEKSANALRCANLLSIIWVTVTRALLANNRGPQ